MRYFHTKHKVPDCGQYCGNYIVDTDPSTTGRTYRQTRWKQYNIPIPTPHKQLRWVWWWHDLHSASMGLMNYLYNSVIFEGATLVYRPDCNAEGGCHAAIGCDSRPRHCRRDDIPAWRPNKITLLSLLPLDLTMYHRYISLNLVI